MKIPNKYTILRKLGSGTFGKVFEIEYQEQNITKREAIKIFSKEEGISVDALREINILKLLNSEFILKINEVGFYNEKYYMTTELCDNDLEHYLDNNKLSFKEKKELMVQVVKSIDVIHSHKILHRDIKRKNILIKDKKIKMADFGISRQDLSNGEKTNNVYTLMYRPPELMIDREFSLYTFSSDIWAMMVVLVEIMFNELGSLFRSDNELSYLKEITHFMSDVRGHIYKRFQKIDNLKRKESYNFYLKNKYKKSLKWKIREPIIPIEELKKFIDLAQSIFITNDKQRPNIKEVMKHPFFNIQDDSKISLHISEFANIIYVNQNDINQKMLVIVIDWLNAVKKAFKLRMNTFVIIIKLLFEYLNKCTVIRTQLQLITCACMLIASKYEELTPLDASTVTYISAHAYTIDEVLFTENKILETLNFKIPNTEIFSESEIIEALLIMLPYNEQLTEKDMLLLNDNIKVLNIIKNIKKPDNLHVSKTASKLFELL